MGDFALGFEETSEVGPGAWRAQVTVPHESAWYDGHFPGDPILPGVAIVSAAQKMAREVALTGDGWQLAEMSRIRFRQRLGRGEGFSLEITATGTDPERVVRFLATNHEGLVADGRLVFLQTPA
jgi:3-hydroxyacyl-[acyl-carrier-protein] dehydratase